MKAKLCLMMGTVFVLTACATSKSAQRSAIVSESSLKKT